MRQLFTGNHVPLSVRLSWSNASPAAATCFFLFKKNTFHIFFKKKTPDTVTSVFFFKKKPQKVFFKEKNSWQPVACCRTATVQQRYRTAAVQRGGTWRSVEGCRTTAVWYVAIFAKIFLETTISVNTSSKGDNTAKNSTGSGRPCLVFGFLFFLTSGIICAIAY